MTYPSKIETLSLDHWYTIGDLHGNTLKLIYFMVSIGAVTMTKEDYEAYALLYSTYTPPDKAKFDDMEALLKKATVVPGASIRLIGDIFADRAYDDGTMSSAVYEFKTTAGLIETILSNHDAIFILQMELAIYYATHDDNQRIIDFDANRFITAFHTPLTIPLDETNPEHAEQINYFYRSILGLRASLLHGIITPQTLVKQYNEFKNTLKIFSYDYPAELNGEPVLYAHAPVSKQSIKILMGEDNSTANTDHEMTPLIDKANAVLADHAKGNNINLILLDKSKEDTFLMQLIENQLDPNDNDIRQIHGHVPTIFGKRKSLDTTCGKATTWGGYAAGDLTYTKTCKTPELAKKAYAEKEAEVAKAKAAAELAEKANAQGVGSSSEVRFTRSMKRATGSNPVVSNDENKNTDNNNNSNKGKKQRQEK